MRSAQYLCRSPYKSKLRVDEQTSDHFYATEQNLLQVLVDSYRVAYAFLLELLRNLASDIHPQLTINYIERQT